MKDILKKTFWPDALKGGLVLGGLLAGYSLLAGFSGWDRAMPWFGMLYQVATYFICVIYFGKKRALRYGDHGFSYEQGVVFGLSMMIFAGLIVGIGGCVLHTWIAPEDYRELVEKSIREGFARMTLNGQNPELVAMSENLTRNILLHPAYLVFSGVMQTAFLGALVSVFSASFLKRPATINQQPDHHENG